MISKHHRPDLQSQFYLVFRTLMLLVLLGANSIEAIAQNTDEEEAVAENGIRFGQENRTQWRVGVMITASKGPMRNAVATIPAPIDWPEQKVKLVKEDLTSGIRLGQRNLGGVRQILIQMPGIPNGRTAKAVFTYEIHRKEILSPEDTSQFKIPKSVPREIRRWLNSSPYIDSRDSKIRSLARNTVKNFDGTAWEKVEMIYDLVREKVEYREGSIKSATQALRDGYGDCEELTSLFIAMCRNIKVPARMVWVPDHCYPEFYLTDKDDKGHWFPCQAAGTRAFGSMPEMRPILQKGDNFKVKEKPKPMRYVSEWVSAKPVKGSGKPKVKFVFEYEQPNG